jgi:hypothetical protein
MLLLACVIMGLDRHLCGSSMHNGLRSAASTRAPRSYFFEYVPGFTHDFAVAPEHAPSLSRGARAGKKSDAYYLIEHHGIGSRFSQVHRQPSQLNERLQAAAAVPSSFVAATTS